MITNFLPQPKGRPAALERADRRKAITATDEKESKAVKARSGGRCEVVEVWPAMGGATSMMPVRCQRRAVHIHHLLSWNGTRARGESAKSIRKINTCTVCHSAIHGHILRRVGGVVPHWQDVYERVK